MRREEKYGEREDVGRRLCGCGLQPRQTRLLSYALSPAISPAHSLGEARCRAVTSGSAARRPRGRPRTVVCVCVCVCVCLCVCARACE
jgi:hypothetical protein